ncbi:uncharacterized protein LOC126991595 [Eriocheir sinensis]|uniref:uncharacterized protein LOC126991595 n=1 Tax=Eriocheir sinensis TaxID=95602 RepID=UPI0021C95235|nr:uncharacterized protein LOC126991595 [Eriocheir sinensis]
MLPPDTSSNPLPWRVMVTVMQVQGSFPYKIYATSDHPTFSLGIFLWSIFLQVFMFAMSFHGALAFFSEVELDLGTTAFISSAVFMMVVLSLTPIVLGVNSSRLARLLHDMSVKKGVSPPPSSRCWYCSPQTLTLLIILSLYTIVNAYMSMNAVGTSGYIGVLLFLPISLTSGVSYLLPGTFSSMLFGLMTRRLVAATEDTVSKVSMLLAPDGSYKRESDVEAAMLALRDLDAVIQEVEDQRREGTRSLFPVISMFLLMAVLMAIVCPYTLKGHTPFYGSIFTILLIAYYILGSFCHLGHTFVGQVSVAERMLKSLRMRSKSLSFSVKVSQVVVSLSPLLTFDMCGWYRLDYASFLGLINTVVTYLVIIFQVGGITGDPAPFSSLWNTTSQA